MKILLTTILIICGLSIGCNCRKLNRWNHRDASRSWHKDLEKSLRNLIGKQCWIFIESKTSTTNKDYVLHRKLRQNWPIYKWWRYRWCLWRSARWGIWAGTVEAILFEEKNNSRPIGNDNQVVQWSWWNQKHAQYHVECGTNQTQ